MVMHTANLYENTASAFDDAANVFMDAGQIIGKQWYAFTFRVEHDMDNVVDVSICHCRLFCRP